MLSDFYLDRYDYLTRLEWCQLWPELVKLSPRLKKFNNRCFNIDDIQNILDDVFYRMFTQSGNDNFDEFLDKELYMEIFELHNQQKTISDSTIMPFIGVIIMTIIVSIICLLCKVFMFIF